MTDAASLIEPLPGVHVRRLGADDSFATLSVRGTSSTQVAVYLAGVPLTGGADPTLDLSTLPLWPGARARVYRSFAPAALGRGSLGGTLVLDTPSPRAAERTEVWGAVSAFGARRVRIADVRDAGDGVRVATGLSASRSDDDFSYLDTNATLAEGRDVYAARENAGHAAANGLAAIAIPFTLPGTRSDARARAAASKQNESVSAASASADADADTPAESARRGALTVVTLAQIRRQELPGTVRAPTPRQRLDTNRLLAALELTLPAGEGTFGVRGWGRREGLAVSDSLESAQLTLGPTSTSDAIVATGGSVGWRARPSDRWTLETRLDGSAERFAPSTWISAPSPPGATRASAGIGLDSTLRVATPLVLAASARADAWSDTTGDNRTSSAAGAASGAARTNELYPTGNVGGELQLGDVTIAAHGGAVARPPSFVERYGNRGAFIGDASLRPESATTLDGGVGYAKRIGRLRLHLSIAGFATWADDLIVFVPTGAYGRAKATNIGRARLVGTEAEARMTAFGFELRLSHTALGTANQSACRFVLGACERPPLPGRPQHDFVGDLAYVVGPVRVRYGVDLVAGTFADLTGTTRVPDRVLHGVGARVAIPSVQGLSVALDIRNLFDLRVAEYVGVSGPVRAPIGDAFEYPLPGRRILLSARWVFPEAGASASVRDPK